MMTALEEIFVLKRRGQATPCHAGPPGSTRSVYSQGIPGPEVGVMSVFPVSVRPQMPKHQHKKKCLLNTETKQALNSSIV